MRIDSDSINSKSSFEGLYNNKFLKKSLLFAEKNVTLFSATTSLAMSTIVRPVAILSTPKTDKENKKHACAKSLSSSAVNYVITAMISLPLATAVDNITKLPEKFLKKNTISSLKNGSSIAGSSKYQFAAQLLKLGLGFVIALPKSVATCALIPPIMKLFFSENESTQQNNKNIAFTGLKDILSNNLSKCVAKFIDSPIVQKLADRFHNTNFPQHIMSFTDVILTGSFISQTRKNNNIKEERKNALIYNSLISTGLCIIGGYSVNKLLEKPTKIFIKNFTEANKNSPNLDKYLAGIKVAKPALILAGIYYTIIPVVSTFLADRIDKKAKLQ